MSTRIPKYRFHNGSGQALVQIDGERIYLGKYGSEASKQKYRRLIAEWLHRKSTHLPVERVASSPTEISLNELILSYWTFAKGYYVKDGHPTGQLGLIRTTMRLVRELYGPMPAHQFSPLCLKALQQRMIELGQSRRYINDNIDRVKRMMKWAVAQELVGVDVYQALATVPGLRKGRTAARETEPVLPVSDEDLKATLPYLPKVVRAMVELQRLTGCRPGEVTVMRPSDVDRSGDVWWYEPARHKTQHHDRQRRIYIGPRGQAVLRPWLFRAHEAYCFSPRESARLEATGAAPATTQRRKAKRPRPSRRGVRYSVDSYRRAITRACQRAGVTPWFPNQLRHSRGTEIRKKHGLEAAQVALGHVRCDVTQVYAEKNLELARKIARESG